ncbi:SGNH/GDSL hydrolase family protein [Rossellomorea vietnamensis]|uniref:SGNH/GDSL hydrolase family protein n=1 Tax=Rossellomorea vietnamensis TaxID=218284 RepID=A0A5D4K852_9BACI|nr:SGNH/GDSL hydrolase family protein [Rossellomorea vietnamensis]TYR73541.1 SGNH/GDSL hydrolase family protein [Rossellomorea vietnamensis]
MKLQKGEKLLFIGDSVTDCERAKPEGEGLPGSLGNGYVSFVDGLLQAVYPDLGVRVVNKGINGHTVRDLKSRWQEDVLEQKPDWLAVMIGINDVWRQYDTPFITDEHVSIEEYEKTLRKLVTEAEASVKKIVLLSPFYLEPNEKDLMRRTMDEYGQVVKKIAKDTGCLFIDTQAAFNKVLEDLYPAALAWDRVHPSTAGHMVLARSFLKEIGFDWNQT